MTGGGSILIGGFGSCMRCDDSVSEAEGAELRWVCCQPNSTYTPL